MTFAYAACFYPEEEGYSVIVPDFDAATQGDFEFYLLLFHLIYFLNQQ